MRVSPLGRRRVVRGREIMLDGSRELGEDSSAALERIDRCRVVAAGAVFANQADLGAVRGRFPPGCFRRTCRLVPENAAFSRRLVTFGMACALA